MVDPVYVYAERVLLLYTQLADNTFVLTSSRLCRISFYLEHIHQTATEDPKSVCATHYETETSWTTSLAEHIALTSIRILPVPRGLRLVMRVTARPRPA